MTSRSPELVDWQLLEEEIFRFSPRQRAAFAAGCAGRVLPLAIDAFDTCREAIDLAWRFAEGEVVAAAEVRTVRDACQALIDELCGDEEDGDGASYQLNAVMSATGALDTVTSADGEDAAKAADAAQSAAGIEDDRCEEYMDEEQKWQMLALDVVKSAPVLGRNMFSHLPADPQWLQEFRRQNPS